MVYLGIACTTMHVHAWRQLQTNKKSTYTYAYLDDHPACLAGHGMASSTAMTSLE